MKRRIFYVLPALSLFSTSLLLGCSSQSEYDIKFVNYNGTVLQEYKDVKKGETISYTLNNPVRFDDDSNYYVYKGWDKEITTVTKDEVYTAVFDSYPLTAVEETPDSYVDALPSKITYGNILHAFCWTYNDTKDQLQFIKDAGYKAIQLSPVQVPKSNGSSWWSFYQPLAFRIADGDESTLGTKAELQALCEEAEEYGIKIIVDIVFNHMANIGDSELEPDKTPMVSPKVGEPQNEPYIYQHRNDEVNPTFHHNPNAEGSGNETQVYNFGALPDLNTANEYVQGRALDLLKECIDVGVDGFRFDAAKHIETPEDPNYPSNFWPNTLGVAKEYYKGKTGDDLYAYGEILGNPKDRSVDVYTKLMNVTETSYNSGIENGAFNRNASLAVNSNRGFKIDPSLTTTWIESHDTYNTADNPANNQFLSRCWAILSSKKDTTNLFLARPDNNKDPSVATISDYFFRDELVGAANRFHNRFIGGESYETANGTIYINERVKGDDKGAIVVDTNLGGRTTIDFKQLGTAVYYDQLTGTAVTVRNGHATINTGSSGILVLTNTKNVARPSFKVDYRGGVIAKDRDIAVEATNATQITYKINNGSVQTLGEDGKIRITTSMFDSENKLSLTVTASNSQYSVSETFKYNYVELVDGYFNLVNVNPDHINNYDIYMWVWKDGTGGWSKYCKEYIVQDGKILVDTADPDIADFTGFLFVRFNKDHVIADVNAWDDAYLKQTSDIKGSVLEQGYYDGANF